MFRFLFGLREDVTRRAYVRWGFGLMAFKYAVEFGVFTRLHGGLYTPLDFANTGVQWIQWGDDDQTRLPIPEMTLSTGVVPAGDF